MAFAGVDPPVRLVTAVLVAGLVADLRRRPELPALHRAALIVAAVLVVVQLTPLPEGARRAIEPGFAEVMAPGWAPLSLAPWSTLSAVAAGLIALGVAATAARMAATRSGVPLLLGIIAGTGVIMAVLGMAGEAGAPERILLFRDSPVGQPYGSFVNPNHFAQAMELTLPAGLILLAVGARRLRQRGDRRDLAVVTALASAVAIVVMAAALLRSGSRGGILFLAVALAITAVLWFRPVGPSRRLWVVVATGGLLLVVVATLSWTKLAALEDDFRALIAVEGIDGNTRWDLWTGTVDSWQRSPLVGSGLGSYRHVIGLDKPATGESVLEQAHNDWLEWASTTGAVGVVVALLFVTGLAGALAPGRVRRHRFELRYVFAGAALALTATALHEIVGFGLQTPANRLLLAAWIGLVWGLDHRRRQRTQSSQSTQTDEGESHA